METSREQEQKISVLVMGYKRREFIMEALESVLNQTIPRRMYEIICIVGFHDNDFSLFLAKNNIKELYCDGTIGQSLELGLKACNNDIVVFLEDDDRFRNDKLELVSRGFKNYDCVYYHNNVNIIDSESNIIEQDIEPYSKQIKKSFYWKPIRGYRKIIRYRGDFNMSSIAIRKNKIPISLIGKIKASPDSIIFFLVLQSCMPFYFDDNRTTFYRIHDSETNAANNVSLILNVDRTIDVAQRFYESRLIAYETMQPTRVKNIFLGYVLESKFGAYIAGIRDLKPSISETLKFLYIGITRPSLFYLRLLIATVIYGRSPHFVDNVRYKRMRDRYKKIKRT